MWIWLFLLPILLRITMSSWWIDPLNILWCPSLPLVIYFALKFIWYIHSYFTFINFCMVYLCSSIYFLPAYIIILKVSFFYNAYKWVMFFNPFTQFFGKKKQTSIYLAALGLSWSTWDLSACWVFHCSMLALCCGLQASLSSGGIQALEHVGSAAAAHVWA